MACLTYSQLLSECRIHLSSVWPSTRWQKSNLINQGDAAAPNDPNDDYALNNRDDKNVGSGDYVDNFGDDDDVVTADEQSNS